MNTTLEACIARAFRMSDAVWARHANPWSVWTRLSVLPLIALAVWSRVWIGPWCWLAVAAALAWTWFNPRVFPVPQPARSWASRGVFGERVWLARGRVAVPARHRLAPNLLSGLALAGLPVLVFGLVQLAVWPTVCGVVLMSVAKLWFVDRMVWLYDDTCARDPAYARWMEDPGAPAPHGHD